MGCCLRRVDGRATGGLPGGDLGLWTVQDTIDYRQAVTQDFVAGGDGPYTILGRDYVVRNTGNVSGGGSFGVINGTGLRCVDPLNNMWVAFTQTAPAIELPLGALFEDYSPAHEYLVQVFVSENNADANFEQLRLSLRGAAGIPAGTVAPPARMLWMGAGFLGGVFQHVGGQTSNAGTNLQGRSDLGSSFDVVCLKIGGPQHTADGLTGEFGATWPAMADLEVIRSIDANLNADDTRNAGYNDPAIEFGLAWQTANAAVSFASTVQQIRLLRRG